MAALNLKLTEDVEQALLASPSGVIQLDGVDGASYRLLAPAANSVRDQVLDGITEADDGKVEPWDAEQIKSAGRQRLKDQL